MKIESKLNVFLFGVIIFLLVCLSYIFWVPKSFFGSLFIDSRYVHNLDISEFFYRQSLLFDREDTDLPLPYVHYQLARIQFLRGNFDLSLLELEKELALYPNNDHTYYTLGLVYGYNKEEEKAIAAFKKFLVYMPGSWAARNDLAWLQFRIGDIDGALDTILPAINFADPNPWIFNTYGVLLMNKDDFAGAEEALGRAVALEEAMTPQDWGQAYPGNDTRIQFEGLEAMRSSIADNLKKLQIRKENFFGDTSL